MTGIIPEHFQLFYNAMSLQEFQSQAWKKFSAMGIQPRAERWKYFDFQSLLNETFHFLLTTQLELSNFYSEKLEKFDQSDAVLVFMNGKLNESHSRLHEVHVERSLPFQLFSLDLEWYGLLNECFSQECLRLKIKKNNPSRVVRLIYIYDVKQPAWIYSQLDLDVEAHAKVVLMEEHWGEQHSQEWVNLSKKITLNEHSCLHHATLDHQGNNANRFVQTHIQQDEHSFYQHMNDIKKIRSSREDVYVELNGLHSTCDLFGLVDAREKRQCVDVHLDIVHAASHTHSNMFYKGVLDHQTKSIFNGALHVQKKCDHVVAYQGNHHLLLSSQSQAYSKPELQIYSDQVMCKHGATIGQLDQDALFYLCSRGIGEQQAMEMILSSFKEDVRNKLSNELLAQLG